MIHTVRTADNDTVIQIVEEGTEFTLTHSCDSAFEYLTVEDLIDLASEILKVAKKHMNATEG